MKDILKFPLPKKKLIDRYTTSLKSFQSGRSATLIGLPLTGRSVFFRSLVETNKKLLDEVIDRNQFDFIFIDRYSPDKSPDEYQNFIFTTLSQSRFLKNKSKSVIQNNSYRTGLKKQLSELNEDYRIVVTIFAIEEYAKRAPEFIKVISQLYKTDWGPHHKLVFFFPNSPIILKHEALIPIHTILHTKVDYFPLLDQEEMDYTRKRFEELEYFTLSDEVHKEIAELSGGHYSLYKAIGKAYAEKRIELNKQDLKTDPQIREILKEILLSGKEFAKDDQDLFSNNTLESIGLIRNKKFTIPLLPIKKDNLFVNKDPPKNMEIRDELSPQELLIFDFLNQRLGKIVTKEDIAKRIWGEDWIDKYSEQALDKTISRLRKKITSSENSSKFRLTTIRNRGIRLIN